MVPKYPLRTPGVLTAQERTEAGGLREGAGRMPAVTGSPVADAATSGTGRTNCMSIIATVATSVVPRFAQPVAARQLNTETAPKSNSGTRPDRPPEGAKEKS